MSQHFGFFSFSKEENDNKNSPDRTNAFSSNGFGGGGFRFGGGFNLDSVPDSFSSSASGAFGGFGSTTTSDSDKQCAKLQFSVAGDQKIEEIKRARKELIDLKRGEVKPVYQPIEPVEKPIASVLPPVEQADRMDVKTKAKKTVDYLALIVRLKIKRLEQRLPENDEGDAEFLTELKKLLSSFSLLGLENSEEY